MMRITPMKLFTHLQRFIPHLSCISRSLSTATTASATQSRVTQVTRHTKALLLEDYGAQGEALSVSQSWPLPPLDRRSLLVRVQHVSVNPLDVMTVKGYARSILPLATPLPCVLGCDAVGVVEMVGASVWDFKRGDRVWISRDPLQSGTFAERIHVQRQFDVFHSIHLFVRS